MYFLFDGLAAQEHLEAMPAKMDSSSATMTDLTVSLTVWTLNHVREQRPLWDPQVVH